MAEGRSTWKGYLKLSLVTAAVRLAPATSETSRIRFHQLNKATGNRVKQQLVDSVSGEPVEREDIVKGYEYSKGRYVEIDEADLDAVRLETTHTIEIERFVDAAEINDIYRGAAYYLMPDSTVADEAYVVIREAMARSGKAAIGRVTISTREHPALIQPCGNGLLLNTLRPEREVRQAKDYFADIPDIDISADLMDMAETLIKSRLGHFDPKSFVDRYQEALRALVEAKMHGVEQPQPEEERPAKVVNLMDALRRSLQASGPSEPAPARKRDEKAASGKGQSAKGATAKSPSAKPAAKKAAAGGTRRR